MAVVSGPPPYPDTRVAQPRPGQAVGFFTDSSICIGCKACEVACKEWNHVPTDGFNFLGSSYDNTGELGANTWRHVTFAERPAAPGGGDGQMRWLMNSDVCKHCASAACLEVCPTGALMRTEFATVVVQEDVCNGCGYCVPACPFGVIDRREEDGRAFKCTLCYDRLKGGMQPACAQACPTQSIQFGPIEELRTRARRRLEQLRQEGRKEARLYGVDGSDNEVGGLHAFFLLMDEPGVYRLPTRPATTTRDLPAMWKAAAAAAGALAAGVLLAFAGKGR
ncbi:MAG: 4Fe-4S dicluster domain-containing protein [Chloroflexi bacterium]|nr:MAG: 4Fe-4S dicluster domain-containing protein [Chloroflexota bacterium]